MKFDEVVEEEEYEEEEEEETEFSRCLQECVFGWFLEENEPLYRRLPIKIWLNRKGNVCRDLFIRQ